MQATAMTIGQVAKEAALGVETIRFYERQGLIPDPPRRRSGYRQYPEETVERLLFIKRAKGLGFSLKEIAELLALRVDPGTSAGAIKQRVGEKIQDVEGKIRSLQRMKKALVELDESCCGCGPTSECPILDAMGGF